MTIFSKTTNWLLALFSCVLVAFGQPAWISWAGLLVGAFGFALFWLVLLNFPLPKHRFMLGFAWFGAIQLVQLSWFPSHPYWYIYGVYFFLSAFVGLQFGVLCLFITRKNLKNLWRMSALAALWTLMEWSRLFILSGLSWNPVGITLTANLYALQLASVGGILGLSFWVIWTNLLALRCWIEKRRSAMALWLLAMATPYIYGVGHLSLHTHLAKQEPQKYFNAALVQTAFPVEESHAIALDNMAQYVMEEWRQILQITTKLEGHTLDLIALPEFVVPFGTYSFVYPLQEVWTAFHDILGPNSVKTLPKLELPYVVFQATPTGPQPLVNNAYWVQGLANHFKTCVITGMEDAEDTSEGERQYYSAAMLFYPTFREAPFKDPSRYEKRVLVPMGEYIPFAFCRTLAGKYGICGSFTHGQEAKVFPVGQTLVSPSICYEETFAHVIREGRQNGADLFVNLTSDVWYPNSRLPRQHLDHARPRTVENGVPLIRACNTGITAAIDSLGRNIAVLGGDHPESAEWTPDLLIASVPTYNYRTLYSWTGDSLLIVLCFAFIAIALFKSKDKS